MALYERFLGRPFAGHRDSVSELVGDVLEVAVEGMLTRACVSYRKTKRAQRVVGFDQAPDFIIPDEFSPQVVIEAKINEDDGTTRDKVTRVQHLATLSEKDLTARRAAPVRSHSLHRRKRIQGAAGGHEKAAVGDPGQGLHPGESGPADRMQSLAGFRDVLRISSQHNSTVTGRNAIWLFPKRW